MSSELETLLLEIERPETTHQRRAVVGDRLEEFCDPRPGVGLRPDGAPDIAWRQIPGGSVEIAGLNGQFDVRPFRVSTYPVTYRQYEAFLDDPNGFRAKKHWTGLERAVEPGVQYRRLGNHPADTVSRHDAVVFCRWLSEKLGFEVRLPHESEWQQAATGGRASNRYPWGRDWQGDRANTVESRLGRTIAVGMYPHGGSAHGVLDLAGGVWEWCSSVDQHRRGRGKKGAEVLRGGSWTSSRDLAHASHRLNYQPARRTYYIGFRVVSES